MQLQNPEQQLAAADDGNGEDDETSGVRDFLAVEARRGNWYYRLRLALILLLPVALAVGFLGQQLSAASADLADARSLQAVRQEMQRRGDAALALGAEMLAGVRLCIEPVDGAGVAVAAAARFQLAVEATGVTVGKQVLSWRHRLTKNLSAWREQNPLGRQRTVEAMSLMTNYAVAIDSLQRGASAEGQRVSRESLWQGLASSAYMTWHLLHRQRFSALAAVMLSCPTAGADVEVWGLLQRLDGQSLSARRGAAIFSPRRVQVFFKTGGLLEAALTTAGSAALEEATLALLEARPSATTGLGSADCNPSAADVSSFAYLAGLQHAATLKQLRGIGEAIDADLAGELAEAAATVAAFSVALPVLLAACAAILGFYARELRHSRDSRIGLGELIIAKREATLRQQARALELVHMMLPPQVAQVLREGGIPQPKLFEQATVYFSSVSNFKYIVSRSRPIEIMDLLNRVYSIFDARIERYQVYKVETIADSYMVVSGLPVSNGRLHAPEIARMSLALMGDARAVEIPHLPEEPLMLRVGVHTGRVVAGVMGVISPRYCLFGDTVNMASRMCSHGADLKIHVSPATAEILTEEKFHLSSRGPVYIKGKGELNTHWLLAESKPKKRSAVQIQGEE